MQQILTYAFLVIYTVTILGIVLVIITDNRNPLKTLPWIIVLVFAPVVGLVFYFFFGQNLSKQMPKCEKYLVVKAQTLPK